MVVNCMALASFRESVGVRSHSRSTVPGPSTGFPMNGPRGRRPRRLRGAAASGPRRRGAPGCADLTGQLRVLTPVPPRATDRRAATRRSPLRFRCRPSPAPRAPPAVSSAPPASRATVRRTAAPCEPAPRPRPARHHRRPSSGSAAVPPVDDPPSLPPKQRDDLLHAMRRPSRRPGLRTGIADRPHGLRSRAAVPDPRHGSLSPPAPPTGGRTTSSMDRGIVDHHRPPTSVPPASAPRPRTASPAPSATGVTDRRSGEGGDSAGSGGYVPARSGTPAREGASGSGSVPRCIGASGCRVRSRGEWC